MVRSGQAGEGAEKRIAHGHRHGHPDAHRRRLDGAHDPARRKNYFQRPKRAVIDRQKQRRRDALENHLGGGQSRSHPGIVESRHLRADVAQIDSHLIVFDFDADADRNMFAEVDAIVVHERFGFVNAVGNLPHRRARELFALLVDELNTVLNAWLP